jgi:HPt (histidine-containing phosphotransfer) domain-containing protein
LLRHFASEHSQDMQLLSSHLQAGDKPAATRLAHTLRGVAATLGWVSLADQSQRLEHDLSRDGSELTDQMAEIANGLGALLELLGQEEPEPTSASAPINGHWQQQLLRQIEGLLLQSDTAVIPLFEQYAGPLLLSLGPKGETLARQLKVFDFDSALLTLRSLQVAQEDTTGFEPASPDAPTLHPAATKRDKGLNH